MLQAMEKQKFTLQIQMGYPVLVTQPSDQGCILWYHTRYGLALCQHGNSMEDNKSKCQYDNDRYTTVHYQVYGEFSRLYMPPLPSQLQNLSLFLTLPLRVQTKLVVRPLIIQAKMLQLKGINTNVSPSPALSQQASQEFLNQ